MMDAARGRNRTQHNSQTASTQQIQWKFALGAGKVGNETREREAAYPLGAVGLDFLRSRERNAKALLKPLDGIALKNVVGTNPRGGKRAKKR